MPDYGVNILTLILQQTWSRWRFNPAWTSDFHPSDRGNHHHLHETHKESRNYPWVDTRSAFCSPAQQLLLAAVTSTNKSTRRNPGIFTRAGLP